MGDPTNRNDPAYANNPNYTWSGGRWQFVSNPATANQPAAGGKVTGESLGTPGGWSDVFGGLGGLLSGKGNSNGVGTTTASIPNAQHWQDIARAGAPRQQAVNPYNQGIADQSRGAQLALIQQMRGQMSGPSIANMQGQRALGQSGQQALMGAAMGGPGARAGMLQAGQVGGGLAGDVGQARLAEIMRAQAGMGGVSGNLRGNDLRSADAQMNSGMQAQGAADQRSRFYADLGSGMQTAQDRTGLENYKLVERLKQAGKATNEREISNYLQMLGSMFGGVS